MQCTFHFVLNYKCDCKLQLQTATKELKKEREIEMGECMTPTYGQVHAAGRAEARGHDCVHQGVVSVSVS